MSEIVWSSCPSSSVLLQCPSCPAQIECEIEVFAYSFSEDGEPKVAITTKTNDQPMWDHAFLVHTPIL